MEDYSKLQKIRCFLLDMDGTIFLSDRLLPGAQEFLELLEERGIQFYFLTNNSSRSKVEYAQKLKGFGLNYAEDRIFTSGEATAIYLKKQKPGARLYLVGTPPLEHEMAAYGFELVQDDPDFAVLGFDMTLTYEKLRKLCGFVRKGVPYIATHPDINCPTKDGFIPDIGAMIELVAASTGRRPDVIVGKPHPPVVEALVEKTGFPVDQLGMIGDRLYTDIALGKAGLTTVLVLTGETKIGDLEQADFHPDYVMENLVSLSAVYRTFPK